MVASSDMKFKVVIEFEHPEQGAWSLSINPPINQWPKKLKAWLLRDLIDEFVHKEERE